MNISEERYGLAKAPGSGMFCGEEGLFVGAIPLLERDRSHRDSDPWKLRHLDDLNRDLEDCYGLPIEVKSKISGLALVARALDRGDVAYAQIAALHLRIPDPPVLAKSTQAIEEVVDLAQRLQASGLLKAGWDASKHPRWPAKSPGGVGGEFAPVAGAAGSAPDGLSPSLIPAQTMPLPLDIPFPGEIPLPSEILPPPLVVPNVIPRGGSANPYPDRAECVAEWARARKFCRDLQSRGLLGSDAYRGTGMTFDQCVRGQVTEDCGGNSVGV